MLHITTDINSSNTVREMHTSMAQSTERMSLFFNRFEILRVSAAVQQLQHVSLLFVAQNTLHDGKETQRRLHLEMQQTAISTTERYLLVVFDFFIVRIRSWRVKLALHHLFLGVEQSP